MIDNFENLRISEDVAKIDDEIVEICKKLTDELSTIDKPGLTASLIGYDKRIIALKFEDKVECLINPAITHKKKEDYGVVKEQSLLDGKYYIIPRYKEIEVFYTDSEKHVQKINLKGSGAFLYQQLNDLLGGILISDYGLEIDDDFDDLTKEEQEQIIEQYLRSFSEARDYLQSEIDQDPELHDIQRTLQFIQEVNSGETKLRPREPNRETRRRLKKQAKALQRKLKEQQRNESNNSD